MNAESECQHQHYYGVQIAITLCCPDRHDHDLVLRAPPETRLGEILPQLIHAEPAIENATLVIDDRRLSGSDVLGRPPLIDGAQIEVEPFGARNLAAPAKSSDRKTEWGRLHAIAGPEIGRTFTLDSSAVIVGRGAQAHIKLHDQDVSRLHARITADGRVKDLGSRNGTELEGRTLFGETQVLPGQILRCGASLLMLAEPPDPVLRLHSDSRGGLLLSRPPRLRPNPEIATVRFPTRPNTPPRTRLPWLMAVVPLIIGVASWWLLSEPGSSGSLYLMMATMAPILMLGNALSERIQAKQAHRRALAEYNQDTITTENELQAAIVHEARRRRREYPDPATLWRIAHDRTVRLWERRRTDSDALTVRFGLATLPAQLTVLHPGDNGSQDDSHGRNHPALRYMPVVVSLRELGVLGLAGAARRGEARWVVSQLATQHMPRDIRLVLLSDTDGGEEWEWIRWLPHCGKAYLGATPIDAVTTVHDRQTSLAVLAASVTRRTKSRSTAQSSDSTESVGMLEADGSIDDGAEYVIIVDAADGYRPEPDLITILKNGAAAGIYTVWVSADPLRLPGECSAVLITGDDGASARLIRLGTPELTAIAPDSVDALWAERLAKTLTPLRDATANDGPQQLPQKVGLFEVLTSASNNARDHTSPAPQTTSAIDKKKLASPAAIKHRWLQTKRSAQAAIGVDKRLPATIDLIADGPHALVAGTTGSGKSELLQTLIAGLAFNNCPDELAFILVDYKGGAAFAECATLPHVTGLVTDLDTRLTTRVLTSLGAELRRRERILATHGVKDHGAYLAARDILATAPGQEATTTSAGEPINEADAHQRWPPMARLVVVVDEFATLAEELPDFVTGLVDLARRGRSLGMHLVLATQRPSGVVSPEIRANTALRICLRVTDPNESIDVIGRADAAGIRADQPGRALMVTRLGLHRVQIAYGGEPPEDSSSKIAIFERKRLAQGTPSLTPSTNVVREHGSNPGSDSSVGCQQSELGQLVAAIREAAAEHAAPPPSWLPPLPAHISLDSLRDRQDAKPGTVLIGLEDAPAQQRQSAYELPTTGAENRHLMIVGTVHSGKTTALRTIALSVGRQRHSTELYVIDCAGRLSELAKLPHCVGVATTTDLEHGARMLARLSRRVAARKFSPPALLLLDSWEGFVESYGAVGHGELADVLASLLRTGAGAGLQVVITGDRALVSSRISTSIRERLVLAMAEPDGYRTAGIPSRHIPTELPPGRALRCGEQVTEVQFALTAPRDIAPQPQATATPNTVHRITALPAYVTPGDTAGFSTLPAGAHPIGIGGDAAEPILLSGEYLRQGALVVGPAGSGRTNTLTAIGCSLLRAGWRIGLVHGRRAECLSATDSVLHFGRNNAAELRASTDNDSDSPMAILVDDADAILDTEVDALLIEIAARETQPVIASATAEKLHTVFRGVTMSLRRSRTGVLLWPGRYDGDLFGLAPFAAPMPRYPGRGLLAIQGVASPIQICATSNDIQPISGYR